jgi:hypothetical protein
MRLVSTLLHRTIAEPLASAQKNRDTRAKDYKERSKDRYEGLMAHREKKKSSSDASMLHVLRKDMKGGR